MFYGISLTTKNDFINSGLKGKLIQTWKSPYKFAFI